MELFASIVAKPLTDTDVFLSATEDFSLQQSIYFISTLMTVTLLLQRANIITSYITSLVSEKLSLIK